MRKKRKQKGFTIIELLVVMVIFITVGGLVLSILYISLRGSTKTQVVTTVKENGSFALSQMVKSIRYAKSLDDPVSCIPSTSVSSITITSLDDDGQITFSCPAAPGAGISSNSASLVDINAVTVSNCSFTCTQAYLSQPPRVTIQFTLTAKSSNNFTETQSVIPFQSSVIMRNVTQNN